MKNVSGNVILDIDEPNTNTLFHLFDVKCYQEPMPLCRIETGLSTFGFSREPGVNHFAYFLNLEFECFVFLCDYLCVNTNSANCVPLLGVNVGACVRI